MTIVPVFLKRAAVAAAGLIRRRAKEGRVHLPPDPGEGRSNPNTRGWINDMLAHHRAESLAIDRAAQAVGYGLPAGEHVSRFAGQSSTTTINKSGFVSGALTSAALLGGSLFGLHQLGALRFPERAAPPAVEKTETKVNSAVYDITLEAKEGKLIPTEIEKVKDDRESKK